MDNNNKPSKETLERWHQDPSNWKGGIFYYNKKDKRIFPPKRIRGFGWTVNFANPYSYFTFVGLLILFYFLVTKLK